jgi:hypothetical protein
MHTYESLYLIEYNKDMNRDTANIDDYVLFFLYSMLQAITAYSLRASYGLIEEAVERVAKKSNCENRDSEGWHRPLDVWDCKMPERDKEMIEIFDSPFSISIFDCRDFLHFYFEFMRDVMFIVEPNRMGMNVKKKGACIPVSYEYFQKIIVGDQVGGWQLLDINGKIKTVKKPLVIETILQEDKIYKKGVDNITTAEHRENIAKRMDEIKWQKTAIEIEREEMKERGYPYQDTHAEYVRFLKNNLQDMKFKDYKLQAQLILDMFIPSSLS